MIAHMYYLRWIRHKNYVKFYQLYKHDMYALKLANSIISIYHPRFFLFNYPVRIIVWIKIKMFLHANVVAYV